MIELRWMWEPRGETLKKILQYRQRPDFYIAPDDIGVELYDRSEPQWSDWQEVVETFPGEQK